MFDLAAVQTAVRDLDLDGWLLYDFRGLNVLARRVLALPADAMLSRRWFYFIPARANRASWSIASSRMHSTICPARRGVSSLAGVGSRRRGAHAGARRVAMEYVPRNANPYVSRVDAGTVELVRSNGVEIVSSGDLVQKFEATWDDEQWAMHLEAAKHTRSAYDVAFAFIADRVRRNGSVHETEVQQRIFDHFAQHGMVTDHPPIVGVGPHCGDPHYAAGPAYGYSDERGRFRPH